MSVFEKTPNEVGVIIDTDGQFGEEKHLDGLLLHYMKNMAISHISSLIV